MGTYLTILPQTTYSSPYPLLEPSTYPTSTHTHIHTSFIPHIMSGPYDSYGGGSGYGGYQQGGGYPPQQGYGQGYPPQQGYGYGQQQQGYSQQYDQNQNFGPPRRQDSFGPPQQGGFQHGQQGNNYGNYYGSNPQGHSSNDAYAANQAWMNSNEGTLHQGQGQGQGQGQQQYPQTARQSSDPNAPNYDPNAPPMTEQDRGLLGAMAGGAGGAFLGHKAGHGFLGTIGGAIMGSIAEDMAKKKKKGSSSWGGSSWGGR